VFRALLAEAPRDFALASFLRANCKFNREIRASPTPKKGRIVERNRVRGSSASLVDCEYPNWRQPSSENPERVRGNRRWIDIRDAREIERVLRRSYGGTGNAGAIGSRTGKTNWPAIL